ncbi:hypothetical protein RB614_03110 [Phytohabitans sp. ZYX-F-186]|uniref:Uncharacterized protein n=1 Tax=Phytohabitans maris TaxID=3071409 RepID=A0ABU0ZC35_9ACTN|nr:hypothetical protein [Phytohabitans sp. ZYX-F-186]MDQ7903502.1 hypothetical protein [Phytohabitans sp. ZYX-F-186]
MPDLDNQISRHLPDRKIIVICGREDDAEAWRDLLGNARCLAVPLDAVPQQERPEPLAGASGHLVWQHSIIAGLEGDGWLRREADRFDPDGHALLLIPDPLDPPRAGDRPRLGRRHPTWRVFEDKTVVDTLWDLLGVPRATSVVADSRQDLATLGPLVDHGAGVVCATQPPADVSAAGGDGLWWWRAESPRRKRLGGRTRLRLMPLLEGRPVRLHGLIFRSSVLAFPPMDIVSLPRLDHGTFLLAGAVPATHSCTSELAELTGRIGTQLRATLSYRGAFSVDGILTVDGFRPTDFNPRLTSAIEAAPSAQRVRLHAANLLLREGIDLDVTTVEPLVGQLFGTRQTFTLYGAAATAKDNASRRIGLRWQETRLVAAESAPEEHGHISIATSLRGWLVTANLAAPHLPAASPLAVLAPQVFRLCDEHLGTDFGHLIAPFGIERATLLLAKRASAPLSLSRADPAQHAVAPASGRVPRRPATRTAADPRCDR